MLPFCAKQHFQGGRGPTDDHPDPLPSNQQPASRNYSRSTSAAAVKHLLRPEQNMGGSHNEDVAGIFPLPL